MYKIDIKEALYPIQIVLVVYKKFSKTSVFIDRKLPIHINTSSKWNEAHFDNDCLQGFRPGLAQTSLHRNRRCIEAWNFGISDLGSRWILLPI